MNTFLQKYQAIISQYDLPELKKNGFYKDYTKYCFTTVYPPLKAMDQTITPTKVFFNCSAESNYYDLYLHFPFCSGKCTYCHFSTLSQESKLIDQYLNALDHEVDLIKQTLPSIKIRSIFLGGGSPSLIPPERLSRLLNHIHQAFSIKKNTITVTLEVHPEIINQPNYQEYFQKIKESGINRLSIGVQDFNPKTLKYINRRHTHFQAIKIITEARKQHFIFNIDLLTPLPYQTIKTWLKTLAITYQLHPDSVTVYTTAIRPQMSLYRDFIQHRDIFPNYQDSLLMYIIAQQIAKTNNYNEQPVGWFSKNKTLKKPSSVSNGTIGLGVSSYSYFNNYQYYNTPRIKDYILSINQGELPLWKGIKVSAAEQSIRDIIFGIKQGTVSIAHLDQEFSSQINLLLKLKLITINQDILSLTPKGKLFSDEIILLFISDKVRQKIHQSKLNKDPLLDLYNFFYEI